MSSDLTFITNESGRACATGSASCSVIDELVYALYGLTPDEIKIVEGAATKH